MKLDDILSFVESCRSAEILREIEIACECRRGNLQDQKRSQYSVRPLGKNGRSVNQEANPGKPLGKR